MNKELELRYSRIEKELKKYLQSSDVEKNKNNINVNVCNIGIVDLQNIVAKINTETLNVNDVFFKSIKPIVKTAMTTISIWNYLLETPTRTIKSIREYEDLIKNEISELEEFRFFIKSIIANYMYVMMFLIKNRAGLRVADVLSIVTDLITVMKVISDLSENCPLVKDTINTLFGDNVISELTSVEDTLNSIVESKSSNTTTITNTKWNTSYVDSVISAYKRVNTQTIDYNLDNYIEQLVDFTDRFINNNLTSILDVIGVEIDVLNGYISNIADGLVDTIMGLGFGDMLASKEQLQSCLNIIIKYDTANKKEYETYYEKLNRIPKTLGVFSVNKNPYIINKAKLSLLLMRYYFVLMEKNSYDRLTNLLDNIDCVAESNVDDLTGKKLEKISLKDKNALRGFTFFAIYYYGVALMLDFIQSQIDTNSIANNSDFDEFIQKEKQLRQIELDRQYAIDIQNIDNSIISAVDEIMNNFPELDNDTREELIKTATDDLKSDYIEVEKKYNTQSDSLYDEVYNYYINNTKEVYDLSLREVIENQSTISNDLSLMKTTLIDYYFSFNKNLGDIVTLLSNRNYRQMIDSIIASGTNTEIDKEVVIFLNDQFLFDVFGNEQLVLLENMGFEINLSDFVSSNDNSGATPSLYYMIDKYTEKQKVKNKSYFSSDTLKNSLTKLIDTYFGGWKKFKIEDIMKEYYSVLKDIKDNDNFIDYNGVKPQLDMLMELVEESVDDFKEAFASNKFEFKNDVYNVGFIDKIYRVANLRLENYIESEM